MLITLNILNILNMGTLYPDVRKLAQVSVHGYERMIYQFLMEICPEEVWVL